MPPEPIVGAVAAAPASAVRLFWGSPDRAFPWCAVALTALAIWPIWSSRFLPLLDEPNHLSAVYLWHELSHASSPLHEFYELNFAPVSYLLHYGLSYVASFVLGVEWAHKLVLSLYVLAFPLAGWCWCRATGRTLWLSLTTLPLAYSISWAHGFHAFNIGLAACLFGVVAADVLLRRPGGSRALWLAGLSVACYFGHPLALVLLWFCTLVLWLVHRPPRAALALSGLSLLPSAALFGWQLHAASVHSAGLLSALGPDFPIFYLTVWRERVLDFAAQTVNPLAGTSDSQTFVVMLVGGALLLAAGAARAGSYRSLALAAGLFGLYLVLPAHFYEPVHLWVASGRVAPLAAFFWLLSPAIADSMRARWLALAISVVGAVVPLQTGLAYRAFGREMAAFEYVLAACPVGAQVLTVRIDGSDRLTEGFDQPVYRQLASWVQVVHGGFNPLEFPRPIAFPFAIKKRLPAPHWRHHERFLPLLDPAVFGCVLTMSLPEPLPSELYELARAQGRFALYCAAEEGGGSRCRPAARPAE